MHRPNVSLHRKWISDASFFSSDPLEGEEWISFKEIKGINLRSTYYVSNKGRIKKYDGTIAKGSIDQDGYHEVGLACSDSAQYFYVRVHYVVLTLFKGGPPANMSQPTVQHINHDKLDNRVENLCWMTAFDNNQEGHAKRCKIIDSQGEHIFNSQKFASKYIGRYEDYIAECIRCGYKLTNIDNIEVRVFTEVDNEWIEYVRPVARNRIKCKLELNGQVNEFESYQECSRFLCMPESYIGNAIMNNWPILPKQNHHFYIYNRAISDYEEYHPSSYKKKEHAIRCKITTSEGNSQIFSSITAAARFIGRDSEYLRLALKAHRTVIDNKGNTVEVISLDSSL